MKFLELMNATGGAQDAYNAAIASSLGINPSTLAMILAILAVWSIVWKGLALWKAVNKKHLLWFILLLIVNTAGILEILYIYVFSGWVGKIGKPAKSRKKKL